MKAAIVKIGNSKGIRIPKAVFDQCGFEGSVEMEILNRELVIRPAHKPRDGWAEAFLAMADAGDDVLVDQADDTRSKWDDEEWEWK